MDERVKKFRELMDGPNELKALQRELETHLRRYGDGEIFPNMIILKDESYIEKVFGRLDKNDLTVDCISRQAVLELIADFSLSMGQVVKAIHALPPYCPNCGIKTQESEVEDAT